MSKKLFISILVMMILMFAATIVYAANGSGSFLYHRYGFSINPTFEFMYSNGTTISGCADTDDVPMTSRQFSPSSTNTGFYDFKDDSSGAWIINVYSIWTYDIGAEFQEFETNKPISGQNYYLTEAHVSPEWLWEGYYTDLPGTIGSHLLDGAIYKDTHVEADIWTKEPELLDGNTVYTTQWAFSPGLGHTYDELSQDYGHAHGIYIYRWWNAIHQATRHGDPMDKISWRDQLGTFGSNATCSVSSYSSTDALQMVEESNNYTIYEDQTGSKIITPLTAEGRKSKDYIKARTMELQSFPQLERVRATVTFKDIDLTQTSSLFSNGDFDVLELGFSTSDGSGAYVYKQEESFESNLKRIESTFGIQIQKLTYVVVEASVENLNELSNNPNVLLVDPAAYLNSDGTVIPTEMPSPAL